MWDSDLCQASLIKDRVRSNAQGGLIFYQGSMCLCMSCFKGAQWLGCSKEDLRNNSHFQARKLNCIIVPQKMLRHAFHSQVILGWELREAVLLFQRSQKHIKKKVCFITLCARLLKTILQKTENIHAFKFTWMNSNQMYCIKSLRWVNVVNHHMRLLSQ